MKRHISSILGAFLLSRIVSALFVYLGHLQRPYLAEVQGGWRGVEQWWINPWTTYDSEWLINIATQGYQDHTTAFFPLYPYLLKWSGEDMVHIAAAGVLISHVALLLGLFFVFQVTKAEFNVEVAHKTVWFMAFWPTSVFYSAVYTESLFIFLLALTFWTLRQKRWGLSAVSAGLTAACRNPGMLIGFSIALYPLTFTENKLSERTYKLVVACVPIVVFLLIQAWFWMQFKDPLSGINSQEYFHRNWTWPWTPLIKDIVALCQFDHSFIYNLITLTSLSVTFIAILMVAFGWKEFKLSYLLLIGGITLMNLGYARDIGPHTISQTRYMGALYPFIQILVVFISRQHMSSWLKGFFIVANLYLFIVFSYLFGLKGFLG